MRWDEYTNVFPKDYGDEEFYEEELDRHYQAEYEQHLEILEYERIQREQDELIEQERYLNDEGSSGSDFSN